MWLCGSAGLSSISQPHAHCCLPASCWARDGTWLHRMHLLVPVGLLGQSQRRPCLAGQHSSNRLQDMPVQQYQCVSASLACLQQIYVDGLFHPTVTSSMASPLYQNNFSTSAILQQPASIKANLTCNLRPVLQQPLPRGDAHGERRSQWEPSAICSAKL